MLRIVIWPVIVFAVLGAALFALIVLATPEQSLLTQETIDNVNNARTASENSLDFENPAAGSTASEDPKLVELNRLQQQVEAVLIRSLGYAITLGLFLAIAWGFHARSLEAGICGPSGQRQGFPWWFGLMLIFAVTFAACYWFLARDVLILPNPVPYWTRLGAIIGSGLGGYWLATALSASVTMRPSVPLASLLTRAKKGA